MISKKWTTLINNKGLGMTQALLFIALMSILLYGFTDSLLEQKKRTNLQTSKEKRFLANSNIKRLLLSDFAITLSSYSSDNRELAQCALGASGSSCLDGKCCLHDKPFTINLIEPTIDLQNIPESARTDAVNQAPRLTGSEKNPVYYSQQGIPNCTDNCTYYAYAMGTPHCPGKESHCFHAEYIKVDLYLKSTKQGASTFRDRHHSLIYPVMRNYAPIILNATNLEMEPNKTFTYNINVDPGHPSEKQTFTFSKCEITEPKIATIACTGFIKDKGYFEIHSTSPGFALLRLQVSDGQMENTHSQIVEIPLVVK